MAALYKQKVVLKSRFLIFFLSCKNEKKFYERRDKEFKNSLIKNISTKLNSLVDNQGDPGENTGELPQMMEELDREDDAYLDEKISIHLFLEDLRENTKVNRPLLIKAKKGISDLVFLMKQVSEKMITLGNTFGQLSESYLELEKIKRPEMVEIVPLHSRIYNDLKMSFSRWSNLFEHQQKHIQKLFTPTLTLLKQTNKNNLENLSVRANMVKKLIHTLDRAKMGKEVLDKKQMMFGTQDLVRFL